MGSNFISIPKLQRLPRWSLGMDKQFHLTLFLACYYLSMLGLKLNHVSKRGPRNYIFCVLVGIIFTHTAQLTIGSCHFVVTCDTRSCRHDYYGKPRGFLSQDLVKSRRQEMVCWSLKTIRKLRQILRLGMLRALKRVPKSIPSVFVF